MNTFEFHKTLEAITSLDVVRGARQVRDGLVILDVLTGDGRSQVVNIDYDSNRVAVFSEIGPAPQDRVQLWALLAENMDGYYSRVAIVGARLVQVYRYALDELEPTEFAKALLEVANYADIYERKYFGGTDRG
jgi:hypothetical protein